MTLKEREQRPDKTTTVSVLSDVSVNQNFWILPGSALHAGGKKAENVKRSYLPWVRVKGSVAGLKIRAHGWRFFLSFSIIMYPNLSIIYYSRYHLHCCSCSVDKQYIYMVSYVVSRYIGRWGFSQNLGARHFTWLEAINVIEDCACDMRTHTSLWGSWDMPEKLACRQTYNIDEVRWNLKECSCCLSDAGLLSKFGELGIFCLLMDFFPLMFFDGDVWDLDWCGLWSVVRKICPWCVCKAKSIQDQI